jgi:hypothetical protein
MVKTHLKSNKDKSLTKTITGNQLLTAFIPKKITFEELKVSMIELAQVYHGVNHHHSCLSIDCGLKINSKLYSDSIIGKKIHCGRTNAESIVENILEPKFIELCLEAMKAGTANPVPFSLASDASNKGNHKLFPIAVKYFDINKGFQNKIIYFYEDSDESPTAVVNQLTSCLNKCGLNIANVSAYTELFKKKYTLSKIYFNSTIEHMATCYMYIYVYIYIYIEGRTLKVIFKPYKHSM